MGGIFGAIGRPIDGFDVDVRKGAGNFLKGETPSQDIVAVFVGISRDRKGIDVVERLIVVKSSNEPFSMANANAAELSPAV